MDQINDTVQDNYTERVDESNQIKPKSTVKFRIDLASEAKRERITQQKNKMATSIQTFNTFDGGSAKKVKSKLEEIKQ